MLSSDSTEAEFKERLESADQPESVYGAIETELTGGDGETVTFSQEVWFRDDGVARYEVAGEDGWTVVVDGEQLWQYAPAEEHVVVQDSPEQATPNLDETERWVQDLIESFDIEEVSETTVEGHETYHVVLEPPGGEGEEVDQSVLDALREPFPGHSDGGDRTDGDDIELDEFGTAVERAELWLDRTHMYPARASVEDEEGTLEWVYRNLTFEEVPDETFTFEPPENATVEELERPDTETVETIEEADDSVPFDIVEPTVVPDGYEFEGATILEYEQEMRTAVALTYHRSIDLSIGLIITDEPFDEPFDFGRDRQDVEVDGQPGTYVTDDLVEFHMLHWECGDLHYIAEAYMDVDRATLFEMAESVDCT